MPSARGGPGHSGRCGFLRVLSTIYSRMKGFYNRNYHYLCFGQVSPKKGTLEPFGGSGRNSGSEGFTRF